MKLRLISTTLLVVLGIGICLISSCNKEEVKQPEIEIPKDVDITKMEAYYNTIKIKIKSDSKWISESDKFWCYLSPSEGIGDAEITLVAEDNLDEERRNCKITIKSADGSVHDIVINVCQKCVGDYGENSGEILDASMTRRYALGYGYNASDKLFTTASLRSPIFDQQLIKRDMNDRIKRNIDISASGTTAKSFACNLAASVDLEAGGAGFAGQVKYAFNSNDFSKTQYEYSMYSKTYQFAVLSVRRDSTNWEKYVPKAKLEMIYGTNPNYKGSDGIKKLVNNFGTHVVLKAMMGGRIDCSMRIDRSKISGHYDTKAFAKAQYSNSYSDSKINKDANIIASLEENKEACNKKESVRGGIDISSCNGNVDEWIKKITEDNMAWIGSPSGDAMMPIWELCKKDATRAKAIKDYILTMEDEKLNRSPKNVRINIPKFPNKLDAQSSLVKIATHGNHVAVICEEYIPLIHTTERVKVVYPIILNKILTRCGFFLGNSTCRPGNVCWINGKKEPAFTPMGQDEKLYIKNASGGIDTVKVEMKEYDHVYVAGANISLEELSYLGSNGTAEVSDFTMVAPSQTSPKGYLPIVKIGNLFWTRCYSSSRKDTYERNEYYRLAKFKADIVPQTCRLPTPKEAVNDLNGYISSTQSMPSETLLAGIASYTGLNLNLTGYLDWWNYIAGWKIHETNNFFLYTDQEKQIFTLSGGRVTLKSIDYYGTTSFAAPVRYVRLVEE